MFLFNIIYYRFDIIFDLDRSLRLHSFLFGHIFRLYDFSRHLCVGLSYAHHYPVYIHSYLIMSHYRAHYSFAFNATIIPLAFTHAVRHDIIFDLFNFIIVEHNLFKISIYIILSSFSYDSKPGSFNFPSEFSFLGLCMCLILTHHPGVLPKALLLQPSRYALRPRFIFIIRLCLQV